MSHNAEGEGAEGPNVQNVQNTQQPTPNLTAADVAALAKGRQLPAFAVVLQGDALAPRYRHGDLLIVDTGAIPAAGEVVLAEVPPGSGVTCAMRLNGDGDLVDGRKGYVARELWSLLGVVTGAFGTV